jgi:cation transport ATPase
MAKKLQAKIEQLNNEKTALEQQVSALKIQNEESEAIHKTAIEQANTDKELAIKELTKKHETVLSDRDTTIEDLENENKQKQSQIDKRELKKLAEAYSEQEDIFEKESKTWLISLIVAGVLLLISAIVSIKITHNESWIESIKYYIIDFILISAVWFCGAQYANTTKLRYDYANRKTLAQSFSNILNNLAENTVIRDKFIEKTTDVLCAPSSLADKEPVLSKKLIKDTAEIVSSIR